MKSYRIEHNGNIIDAIHDGFTYDDELHYGYVSVDLKASNGSTETAGFCYYGSHGVLNLDENSYRDNDLALDFVAKHLLCDEEEALDALEDVMTSLCESVAYAEEWLVDAYTERREDDILTCYSLNDYSGGVVINELDDDCAAVGAISYRANLTHIFPLTLKQLTELREELKHVTESGSLHSRKLLNKLYEFADLYYGYRS